MPKHQHPLTRAAAHFQGEMMTCALCGKQQQSDPHAESQWRCIEADGVSHYVCPAHFPPDGASAEQFKGAYIKVFTALFKQGA